MTQLRQLIRHLEQVAPPVYQESYDNAGLITGNPDQEVTGVLVCLDSTEAVIREAAAEGCNVVVAHHPIIFKGLKRLTGQTYVERTVIEAIRHGIAVYAIHTNLDNVYHQGVNSRIAEKLGLINTRILAPKKELFKLNAVLSENGNGALQEVAFRVRFGTVPAKEAWTRFVGLPRSVLGTAVACALGPTLRPRDPGPIPAPPRPVPLIRRAFWRLMFLVLALPFGRRWLERRVARSAPS